MAKNLQKIILSNLLHNEQFTRKTLPHIKVSYFENEYVPVYKLILSFIGSYNKLPNPSALEIEFQQSEDISRKDANEIVTLIKSLEEKEEVNEEWLIDSTEKWCKHKRW